MSGKPLSPGMQAALDRTLQVKSSIDHALTDRSPLRQLPLDQIQPSPFQARLDFGDLPGLARDIASNGVLQPVLVRSLGADRYELVAGERRWRASRLAGLDRIPAVVRSLDDTQARLYGLKENLEREDLNAYEVARAAVDLVALSLGQTPDEVTAQLQARRQTLPEVTAALGEALGVLGRDLSVAGFQRHYLKLLRLPDDLRAAIQEGASYAAVTALLKATADQRAEWLPKIAAGEWGVRDVEEALRAPRPGAAEEPLPEASADTDPVQMGKRLAHQLATGRLDRLDGRQRRKAQRLMRELADLLGGA